MIPTVPRTPRLGVLAFLLLLGSTQSLVAAPITTPNRIFAGTWGPSPGDAKVLQREGAGWIDLALPGAALRAVRDLEWADGALIVAADENDYTTFAGTRDPRGRVFRLDSAGWTELSPAAGLEGPIADVTMIDGELIATATWAGQLLRHDGGTSWTVLGQSDGLGQAIVAPGPDAQDILFIGNEWEDSFWAYDPQSLLACGAACPATTGALCPAGCEPGSCIYSITAHDSGLGPVPVAGAYAGLMYRWNAATRVFDLDFSTGGGYSVHALASFDGRLWIGDQGGQLWSTDEGSTGMRIEHDFGSGTPVARLAPDEDAHLLWIGLGDAPFNMLGAGNTGIFTWDGAAFTDRTDGAPLASGVSALLVAPPGIGITCNAGAGGLVECQGPETPVALDASATVVQAPAGTAIAYAWSGDFVEGVASGPAPTVHLAGLGARAVTLTVTAGTVSATCSTTFVVVDTAPPVISAPAADVLCLWPPNHRLITHQAADFSPRVVDACEGSVPWRIVGCVSDQPDDATGDGSTSGDCRVADDGMSLQVRSERQGGPAEGRSYTVLAVATDGSGNASAPSRIGTIFVPHDMSPGPCSTARR